MLLDLIQELKPMGRMEWETLLDKFNRRVPAARERDVRGIQSKFASLHSKKMPTGDPNMPADVKRAKHLHYKIMEESDMVDVEAMSDEKNAEESSGSELEATEPTDLTKQTDDATATASTSSLTTSSRKARRKRKKPEADDAFLKVFLETEKMNQKRERQRMKRDDRNMKMLFGLLTSAIVTLGKKDTNPNQEANQDLNFAQAALTNALDSEDSDSNSCSSIDSGDSPPTVRNKEKAGKKKKKKKKTGKTTGLDE